MDDKADLLTYARDAAAAAVDLYALLGVDATTSKADIHRAWRRTGLKYHPDRAGAAYDAAKYQQFERARNVLADDEARAAYDGARSAAEHQRRQAELMGAERRRFKEELEAGERSSSAAGRGQRETERVAAEEAERETLREAGRRKMEERQRAVREAEVREEARRDERIAELERRLREKEERAKRKAERKRGPAAGCMRLLRRSLKRRRRRPRDRSQMRSGGSYLELRNCRSTSGLYMRIRWRG